MPKQKLPQWVSFAEREPCVPRGRSEDLERSPIGFERTAFGELPVNAQKNSKGEIRTLDLTGMSRALSPAELPCHNVYSITSQSSHKHFLISSGK